MRGRIQAMLERRRQMQEAAALTPADLHDLGLSRGQLDAIMRAPETMPARMVAMARVFGLTEAQVGGGHPTHVDLLTTCATCTETRRCQRALARGDALRPDDCGFCPNAEVYEDLARTALS